jgi:hypothetical protein
MRMRMIGTVLFIALAGCAGQSDSAAPSAAEPAAEVARPTKGIAPTPAQVETYRAELEQLLARRSNRAALRSATGVRSAHVDGVGNVALARYGADGKLEHACLDDVEGAMSFLTEVDENGLEVK